MDKRILLLEGCMHKASAEAGENNLDLDVPRATVTSTYVLDKL